MSREEELSGVLKTLDKLADDYRVCPEETKALETAKWCVEFVKKTLEAGMLGKTDYTYIYGRLFETRELAQ